MEIIREILERQRRIDEERQELKALIREWMQARGREAA